MANVIPQALLSLFGFKEGMQDKPLLPEDEAQRESTDFAVTQDPVLLEFLRRQQAAMGEQLRTEALQQTVDQSGPMRDPQAAPLDTRESRRERERSHLAPREASIYDILSEIRDRIQRQGK